MHSVHVKMKDGREFEGPLHKLRPKLGAFSLMGAEGGVWLFFKDVASAQYRDRVCASRGEEDLDLVARVLADRIDPWDGVTAITPKEIP